MPAPINFSQIENENTGKKTDFQTNERGLFLFC